MTTPETGLARKGQENFQAEKVTGRIAPATHGEHNVVFFSGKKAETDKSDAQVNKEQAPAHKYIPTDEYILPGADPRERRAAIEKAFWGQAGDPNRPLVHPTFVKPRERVTRFDAFAFRTAGNTGRIR